MTERQEGGSAPLKDIEVLDLTHLIAGPFCTMLLSDAGANVIKVEPPEGELSRRRGVIREAGTGTSVSSFFVACNRGKKSVILDLKSDLGRSRFFELVDRADVVVENFRPEVLDNLGLGWSVLSARRPSLIFCSIHYDGATDSTVDAGTKPTEAKSRGALAIIAEAQSGLASHCRDSSGLPIQYGAPLGDFIAGLNAYGAIVTALRGRDQTGEGKRISISMLGSMLAINTCAVAAFQLGSIEEFGHAVPYGYFECSDGYAAIGVNSDVFWVKFCTAIEMPELAHDSRYETYAERKARGVEVNKLVSRWTRNRTRGDVLDILERFGIPVGILRTTREVSTSTDFQEAGLLQEVEDGYGDAVLLPSNQMGFGNARSRVPTFGEHTDETFSVE